MEERRRTTIYFFGTDRAYHETNSGLQSLQFRRFPTRICSTYGKKMILSRSLKRKKPCSRFPHANAFCTSVHICSRRLRDAEIRHGKYTIARLVFFLNAAPYPPNAGIGRKNRKPEPSHGLPNPSFAKRHKRCAPFRPAFPVPEYRNSCRRLFSDNKRVSLQSLSYQKKHKRRTGLPVDEILPPIHEFLYEVQEIQIYGNGHTGHHLHTNAVLSDFLFPSAVPKRQMPLYIARRTTQNALKARVFRRSALFRRLDFARWSAKSFSLAA